jgi:hypothetical protein
MPSIAWFQNLSIPVDLRKVSKFIILGYKTSVELL